MLKKAIVVSIRLAFALFTAALSFSSLQAVAQTWNPISYWSFDQTNPLSDNMGSYQLDPTYYQSVYSIANATTGSVGKSLKLSSASRVIVASAPFTPPDAYTVEFLFKADANINSTIQFISRRDNGLMIRFGYATFRFTTKCTAAGTTTTDNFDISLNGIGRGSYGYYVDGNWHHMVFSYNATTGSKQVWVDGQCPAGFSKTITAGVIPSTSSNINEFICDLNTNTTYYKVFGTMDEIALYNLALPSAMIYKHFQEFQAGTHYTFNNSTVAPPAAAGITGTINLLEYAPGHPATNVDAWTQLKTFPVPRYKKGHTLYSNISVFNPAYFTGYLPGNQVTSAYIQSSINFQLEMARYFNYALQVTNNTHNYSNFGDTTRFDGAWIKMANANPQYRASANSYWVQLTPSSAGYTASDNYVQCNCLPSTSYLRNASGQYINESGTLSTTPKLSPEAPIDSIRYDGRTQRYYLSQLTSKMTRNLDVIFENGEIIPWYKSSGLMLDPTVNAAKTAMNVDWPTYIGRNFNRINQAYKSEFMSLSSLANTRFTYYQIAGHPDYNWKYSETRTLNTVVNGQIYSSGDFYPVRPENWRYWSGAWKGWQFMVDSRYEELKQNDNLFSPTVSPGWSNDETTILRPAQWLGLLKALSMTGAEYFHTAYFFLKVPYQKPADFMWQMVMPPYAQGITSRYEDLMRNGYLLNGDYPNDPISNTTQPGYSFYSGDIRKLVVARKHNTLARFAITGTIQPNSNQQGNADLESEASIKLDGQTLTFKIRRQGSTYIYDKTNAAAPVFYQLDGWHESTHPYYWSKDFNIEGELFDNANASLQIATRVPQGTVAGDYRNYTSSVQFKAATSADYYFSPRGTANTTQYVWVRARSTDGTATGFNITLDNNTTTARTISCIQDTAWLWYRINTSNGSPVAFSGVTPDEHKLSITSSNGKLEIDLITITANSGSIYSSGVANPCNVTAVALISPASATTFCPGGSVVLNANTGNSYLWSTGATTSSITATTAGTYVVTVTTNGVSAISPAVTVTLLPAAIASISSSGSTTICSGSSVTLNATSSTKYLWSTGATTASITVGNAGSYSVTTTNSSGCTTVSSPVSVIVSSATTATISPGGSTTICQGSSLTLTASAGNSYLWSTGATTNSIAVSAAGSYTVTVTYAGGCTAVSSPITVSITPATTPTISVGGVTTICQGKSVTLTSSTATTYLWNTGATTPSISVSVAGSYSVIANPGTACATTSNPVSITVQAPPTATFTVSGSLTFCNGGSVTISSSTGAGYSYVWFKNNVVITGATSPSYTATTPGAYKVRVMVNNCTQYSPSYTVTVPCREGAAVPGGNLDASVYPNPSSDVTTIAFENTIEQTVKIELLDIQGKVLENILPLTTLPEGRQEIIYNTATLSKGIYLVRVTTATQSRVIRLICM